MGRAIYAAALVALAFNLRPLFSSLSAVLPRVREEIGLGATGASVATALPVFCLGIFAFIAPRLARRFGTERVLLALLLLLAFGTALRGIAAVPALLLGTLLAGVAIANANVLLPGLIKRDFAHRPGPMAGLYIMAMCAGAALAAGATVPLAEAVGDAPAALALWAVPAVLAAGFWWIAMPRHPRGAAQHPRVAGHWRSPLAWQMTAFMALQSMLSFSVFGWMAPILQARGLDAAHAGTLVSFSVLCQMAACLVAPPFSTRLRDQRWLDVAIALAAAAGFTGLILAPLPTLWGWAALQGLGQGALTSVALTLIVLRSADSHAAAKVSAMVQGVGYAIGATGPLSVGMLIGWTGDTKAAASFFAVVGILCAIAGFGAGRALLVQTRPVDARDQMEAL